MSSRGDDDTEMPRSHHDDAAIEAFFLGQPVDEDLAPLALFADELRSVVSGPAPAPSPQLAALLAHGLSTEKRDPLVAAGSNVTGPATQAAGPPNWRRGKMIIAGFLSGLSLTSKAALGLTMAAGSVTAAGAANALPAPAQNRMAAAVEAATPFSFPQKGSGKANFGSTVSADARDGGVEGAVVSDAARANAEAQGRGTPGGAQGQGQGQVGVDPPDPAPVAGQVGSIAGKAAAAGAKGAASAAGAAAAATTEAADQVPSSVPPARPAPAGSSTSASGEASVSGGGAQGSAGFDTTGNTPATAQVPGSVPTPRSSGRP